MWFLCDLVKIISPVALLGRFMNSLILFFLRYITPKWGKTNVIHIYNTSNISIMVYIMDGVKQVGMSIIKDSQRQYIRRPSASFWAILINSQIPRAHTHADRERERDGVIWGKRDETIWENDAGKASWISTRHGRCRDVGNVDPPPVKRQHLWVRP